ncbi:MAG TPA: TonB-dependent receptor [Candidatus Aminicenantes bacterium]|mgnify:CR=1 FL=1|nr:TonB-dependent receptor [Candidatus Aminicenantes bacterium]
MYFKKTFLSGLLFLGFVLIVGAQVQTGNMSGLVLDNSDGAPLPGVGVVIASPALMTQQISTVTSDKGYYRFPALPPGEYKVTFELQGFNVLVREGIRVAVGETTPLNVKLEASAVEEQVVVTGEAPTLDIQKTTLTQGYAKEVLMALPTQRQLLISFFSLVPGVINETYHGAATSDNAFMLDGVNISDPLSGGLLVSYGFDIMDELSVDTGALRAEYGNVRGAVINAVTKSGGNTVHGQASYYFRNKALQSDNTAGTPFVGQYVGFKNETDWSFNIGGPIVKNRLWFFGNMSYYSQNAYINGFPWDAAQPLAVDNWRYYPYGKLSWQISDSDKLVFSYNHQNIRRTNRDATMYRNVDSTLFQNNPTNTFNLQWTRFFGSNFFLNAKIAYVTHKLAFIVKNEEIGIYDSITRLYSQSYGYNNIYKRPKLQFNLDGTQFVDDWLGRHEFKAGVEVWYGRESVDQHYFRDPRYDLGYQIVLRNGVPDYIQHREDYFRKDNNLMIGGFVQDSWSVNSKLTLNLGVRYDHQEGIVPKQGLDREPIEYNGVIYDQRVLESFKPLKWTTVSPRLGLAYVLTNDNKTVLKASFGRYYASAISNYFVAANPNGLVSWRQRLNPDWTLRGGPYLFSAASATDIDPDMRTPHIDEFTVGLEREIMKNMRLSLRYIVKRDRELVETVDRNALDMAAFANGNLVWTNYAPLNVLDPYSGEAVAFYGVTDTSVPTSFYITNPPGLKRDYDALEVTLTKRYSDRWQLLASYVYAKARNMTGLSSGFSTSLYDNPNAMVNAYGRDPLVSPHQVKIQGSYSGPWGLSSSVFASYLAGQPWTRTIRSADLGLSLPQGNVTIYAEEKGAEALPDLFNVDLRLSKSVTLPSRFGKVELMLDAFNLLNDNTATSLEAVSSSPSILYRNILKIVNPRILRIGARWAF